VITQFRNGGGGARGGYWVESDGQDAVAGVDVAAAGEHLADQGVGFVACARAPGMNTDGSGQGDGGVERGDTDGVGDQLGLNVQDLLAGVDLGQRQPRRDRPVGGLASIHVRREALTTRMEV